MEKIHIQFKESDYEIYYGYCSKYYESHNTLRKQSIHAFFDLYEKGILPVEEKDLKKAHSILSSKCDELKRACAGAAGNESSQIKTRLQACSDLLIFCEDLEKIYRILSKQPAGANYLMILGTFSRILEENKASHALDTFNLNSEDIEALAQPLADCIWERIGPDRHWRSVLRELTFIAARFNHLYSEPRFDLDVAKIVAPSVVARFYKDVVPREILSALPAIFEESDLEEFEAFLDRAPDAPSQGQSMDIDWDTIIPPLKTLTGVMAEQQNFRSQDILGAHGTTPLITPADHRVTGTSALSAQAPGKAEISPLMGSKQFDIIVSPHSTTQVTTPPVAGDAPRTPNDNPYGSLEAYPIKQYKPVLIGAGVIIIFIIGTLMISSGGNLLGNGNSSSVGMSVNSTGWNPFGSANSTGWNFFGFLNSTTNSTTVVKKNTTTAKPAVTTVKPAVTTAKPAATTAKPTAIPTTPVYSATDIGNHLVEIAFGPNNSKIVKPTKSLYAISISGTDQSSDVALAKTFISQFNTYSTTLKLSTNVEENSPADITLVLLPAKSLSQISANNSISYQEGGTGKMYLIQTSEKIYVNSDMVGNERSRWFLRAILINLGFTGETSKYSDSLFYTNANNVAKLSEIDWKAVQLMYGSKITNGMTKSTVKSVI